MQLEDPVVVHLRGMNSPLKSGQQSHCPSAHLPLQTPPFQTTSQQPLLAQIISKHLNCCTEHAFNYSFKSDTLLILDDIKLFLLLVVALDKLICQTNVLGMGIICMLGWWW